MKTQLFQNRRGVRLLFFCSLMLIGQAAFAAYQADDVNFPKTIDVTGVSYQLCSSADMQFYVFVDVGDVALYLADCQHRPFLDQGRLLYFHYNRDFSADDFRKSGSVLLERNMTPTKFAALKEPLAAFNRLYEPVQKGGNYLIGTNAEGELMLFLNGKYLGKTTSLPLSRDYFRIWFGAEPFDKKIKDALTP